MPKCYTNLPIKGNKGNFKGNDSGIVLILEKRKYCFQDTSSFEADTSYYNDLMKEEVRRRNEGYKTRPASPKYLWHCFLQKATYLG